MSYFAHPITNAGAEGLNSRIQAIRVSARPQNVTEGQLEPAGGQQGAHARKQGPSFGCTTTRAGRGTPRRGPGEVGDEPHNERPPPDLNTNNTAAGTPPHPQGVASRNEDEQHDQCCSSPPQFPYSPTDSAAQPAPKATVTRLKRHVAFLRWLDGLGPTEVWLAGVPPAKIAHFAGEAAVLDAAELRDVGEEKRLTLLACLIHTSRVRARDEVVTMFCKRMAAITKKAREHLDWLREQHRAESERLLGVFGDVLDGVRDALGPSDTENDMPEEGSLGPDPIGVVCEGVGRMLLKILADSGGVAALSSAYEAVSAHHGNNYVPLMERYYRSHRSVLFELLEVIALEATSTDHAVLDAVAFLRGNRHRVGEYIPDHGEGGQPVELSFAGDMWQSTLRDRRHPQRLRRRHFEVCVFAHLAAELRTGDIAVAGADSYANLHTQLMSWAECEPLVAEYCGQAGIPATAEECVARWRRELDTTATAVDAGYPDNADLVLDNGRPVLKRRTGKERRASALALEAALHKRLPERGLLDILTRSAYRIGWSRHFGPASGSDPKLRDALGRYVLTTFTYGTLLGPAQVARHMRDQVSAHELSLAFNKHLTEAALQAAGTDVINAFARLDVAGIWGDGSMVAADGSQVDTWENNLLAETSVRYGGVDRPTG